VWKGRVSIESKPFHALPFLLFSHTSHAPIGKRRIRWRASSTTTIAPCSNACPASMSTFISRSMTCCVLVLRSLNKITLTCHPPERATIKTGFSMSRRPGQAWNDERRKVIYETTHYAFKELLIAFQYKIRKYDPVRYNCRKYQK